MSNLKKKIIWVIALIAIEGLFIIFLFNAPFRDSKYEIQEFSVTDYLSDTKNRPIIRNVGEIQDVNSVVEIAQHLWTAKFGIFGDDPNPGEDVEVFFDETENCWLIKGTLPQLSDDEDWLGAIPHVILRSNGDLLAIWMD